MVEHVTITDPNIHEPKGIATANEGEAYIADGLGSGTWTNVFQYGEIDVRETDAVSVSTIGTTAQTFPFSNNGEGNVVVPDAANNRITLTNAGVYFIQFNVSFSTSAVADAGLYEFKIALDGTPTNFGIARQMSGSFDTGSGAVSAIIQASAGQQLTISIESDEAGNTDDIDVYSATLIAFKVGQV